MTKDIPEDAQERDLQRATILALAGFSFTAVAGLAVLDASIRTSLQLATWYVLISFVAYVSALNLQSYKFSRWQNQLASGLIETGSLSLTLTLASLMFTATFSKEFQWTASAIALGAWLLDHVIRLRIDHRYLFELDAALRRKEQT